MGATQTFPRGINDYNQSVRFWADSSGEVLGFRMNEQGNWTKLDKSGKETLLMGTNGQGRVAGYYFGAEGKAYGFVYSNIDGWKSVAPRVCGQLSTLVQGIKNNGLVVSYCGPNVFLYDVTRGTTSLVTTPPAPCTGQQGWGVNDSANVAGTAMNRNGDAVSSGFYSTPNP
jgi:hypothetical protein